jgi:hypothetical protein
MYRSELTFDIFIKADSSKICGKNVLPLFVFILHFLETVLADYFTSNFVIYKAAIIGSTDGITFLMLIMCLFLFSSVVLQLEMWGWLVISC